MARRDGEDWLDGLPDRARADGGAAAEPVAVPRAIRAIQLLGGLGLTALLVAHGPDFVEQASPLLYLPLVLLWLAGVFGESALRVWRWLRAHRDGSDPAPETTRAR